MNNELIARFNTPSHKLTGNHETTSLIDLETGLGNFIASRFSGLVVTDKAASRNKGVLAFLEKELAQRVVCGEFNDPQSILSAISAKKHDSNTLPVINVSMPVSFAFADGEAYRDIELCADLHDKNGVTIAVLNKMFVRSTASITILAEDKPTVLYLAANLATALRLYTSRGHARFTAATKLFNVPITLHGEIESPKSVSFDSVTLPFNDSRLYGMTTSLDVVGELLQAVGVEHKPAQIEVYTGLNKRGQ